VLASSPAIDGIDAWLVANWAVDNSPAGIAPPLPGALMELEGNVWPFNTPGLGEAADSKGPGWGDSCARVWDVVDASAIANEVVGNDRPIVGEVIPTDAVDTVTHLPHIGSACSASVPALPPDSVPSWARDSTSTDSSGHTAGVIDILF